ncbi:hypothetical protein BDV25DRAFT_172048 [Aspergillus avenaceus]|uniref:Polyketide synthase n=1 Tax=Aspergillus avenaceus TaxID=36643 RepID=A0A5N6TW03_ASPAV|nr:hypothetical protein BDV25DRAFT_172048 [Aspergillus avenaceus]
MANECHTAHASGNSAQPLAIVGLSLKLSQNAVDETSFWEVMEKKKDLLTDWPRNRARLDGFYDDGPRQPNMLPAKGIYAINQDPAAFDAPFFSITAKEAAAMNPQQRLALEVAYHAFENAGMTTESLRSSRTAVFSAAFADDFTQMMAKDPDVAPPQTVMGIIPSILPNRLSWYFDLRGPSMHVDTACSASLTAMDLACQSIKTGKADAALIIGVNVMLSPETSVLLGNMNFLSPDGRSFSFDERANGYARGEGVLAIAIKPLVDALNNGDVIRAVVRSTASNHDGRTPIMTKPSAEAQEALIRETYRQAGLGFEQTRYPTGDPIEMSAIGNVFRSSRSPQDPLLWNASAENLSSYRGSVKANIGHLGGTSGLAAIIKVILMLEKGIIPPTALLEKINPETDADRCNIQIPTQPIPWPTDGLRRISINSFGVGGSNAHVILDDAFHYLQAHSLSGFHHCDTSRGRAHGIASNGAATNKHIDGASLLVWSAADTGAIDRMLQTYQSYYKTHIINNHHKLDQLAYTLGTGRSIMSWRTFAVVDSVDGNGHSNQLTPIVPIRAPSEKLSIAFIFTGQGAQYARMGLGLLQYPIFELSLRTSDQNFASFGANWSIQDALCREKDIHLPQFSQPLCTALQIALVDLLRSFGISPAAVVGHSSGEIAAAYAIGALSQRSACKVAYFKGQLVGKLAATTAIPGAMVAINLAEPEVPCLLEKLSLANGERAVHLACVNSPTNVTLSGPVNSIRLVQNYLDQQGIFAKIVPTGVAYHSPAMRTIVTEYRALLDDLEPSSTFVLTEPQSPACVMVSSVTGNTVTGKLVMTPDYWVDNIVSPVRFSNAVQHLINPVSGLSLLSGTGEIKDLIEIGAHPMLRRPLTDTVPSLRHHATLERQKPDVSAVLSMIGSLFCHGHSLSVIAANGEASGRLPSLTDCPPYPFDHTRRYWKHVPGYLLGRRAQDWNDLRPRWRNWLSIETQPWLGDHRVDGVAVCPGTGMVVMAIEAVQQMVANEDRVILAYLIKEARFLSPIFIGESLQDSTETEIHVLPIRNDQNKGNTWYETRVFSYRDNKWTECLYASIHVQYESSSTDAIDGSREQRQEHQRVCQRVKEAALACNPSFQNLTKLRWDGQSIFSAKVDISLASKNYRILSSPVHPVVLDSCVQPNLGQISRGLTKTMCPTMMAHSVANMWLSAKIWDKATDTVHIGSFTEHLNSKTGQFESSVYGIADDDSPLLFVEKIIMAEVSRPDMSKAEQASKSLFHLEWKPQLSSLHGKGLQEYLDAADSGTTDEATQEAPVPFVPKMEFMMRAAARKALCEVKLAERQQARSHIQSYAALLESLYLHEKSGGEYDLTSDELDHLLMECEATEPDLHLFCLIARNLPSILRGQMDPLELLFDNKAAERFYNYYSQTLVHAHPLFEIFDLAVHERPDLRIIEVGAGTGVMTRPVLASLRGFEDRIGRACFCEYMYTDISPAFFEPARKESGEFEGRIFFKTLDLEQDVGSQGFDIGSYDIAIASYVLHATSSLKRTLSNTRNLLKPGGRLVFQEAVVPSSACYNVGTEDWRQLGPLVTEQQWEEVLRGTGFSGIDASIWDHPNDACHVCSTIFSEALPPVRSSSINAQSEAKTWLLTNSKSPMQRSLVSKLRHRIERTETIQLADITDSDWVAAPKDVIISLLEIDSSLLAVLARSENLLWVTAAQLNTNSHYALAQGFLRTMRSEEAGKHIVTLAFQSPIKGDNEDRLVSEVRHRCFAEHPPCSEEEFIVCENQLTIGRLERAIDLEERESPWQSSSRLALDVGTPGMLDTIHFIEIEAAAVDEKIGLECAGTVAGDRVVMTVPGCMHSHPRAPAGLVYLIPDRLSFSEAVAVLIPGMTALGDKVLMLGAEVFATVSSGKKRDLLIERFKIGTDHIFYRRGVDVVVNSLSGDSLRASWECVAPYGHFIEIGKADIQANSSLPMSGFAKNVSFTALAHQLAENAISLLFGASQVEQAFRLMQSGTNMGRIVITLSPDEIVSKYTTLKSTWSFVPDASYLVAGGLGGIGKAILAWMVDKGARYLIVPSRSGSSSSQSAKFIAELASRGVQIAAPRCDVSSATDLEAMLQEHAATMPPIKGCINATMAIHDAIFENMTHSQWSLSIQSKVHTSWNLHQLLPKDLDFFILLSSLMGIYAEPSQSNYAAGCAFQDTLARSRSAQGLRGSVSLDIGYMRSVGYLAQRDRNGQGIPVNIRKLMPIETEDFLEILDYYCDPSLPPLDEIHSQLVIGGRTAGDYIARGEEPMAATLRPFFAGFNTSRDQGPRHTHTDIEQEADPTLLFQQATSAEERRAVVTVALRGKVARALGVALEEVDAERSLPDYGTDSLMAVELRSWIRKVFGANVAVFDILGGKSIKDVDGIVIENIRA